MIAPTFARRRGRFPVFLLVCLLAGISPGALGATLTVTTLADSDTAESGECTLRDAIASANNDANQGDCVADGPYGDDTIQLEPSQAIYDALLTDDLVLTGAELIVNDLGDTAGESLTIDGRVADPSSSDEPPPERTLTIDGNGSSEADASACVTEDSRVGRIFSIQTTATLTGLTLANACAEDDGGVIFNASALTLTEVNVSNGSAIEVGETGGHGGGIFNDVDATLTIDEGSQITRNLATRHGGGIANISSTVIDPCPIETLEQATCTIALEDVTLAENVAGSTPEEGDPILGYGGGLHNADGDGTVAGRSVIVNGNAATVSGGGIWSGTGAIELLGATLQSNQALGLNQTVDTVRGGGAIFNAGGSITVEFSTFAGNVAANNDQEDDQDIHGGGLASDGGTVMFDTVAMNENQVGRSAGETQEGETVPELPGLGGALYVGEGDGGATLAIRNSSLIQNTAVAAGGGLWSAAGTLQSPAAEIENTDFLANQAAVGGGLYYDQGEAVINGGRLSVNQGNSQEGSGGGIFNAANTTLTINDAQIGRNSAAFGGGIDNAGTLNLNRVFLGATQTESRNQAGDNGGGLYNRETGNATIIDSTIAFNDAGAGDLGENSGGGIWNDGTLTVTNSTFSDNRAHNGGEGGGLFHNSGTANLNFVTLVDSSGGGIAAADGTEVTVESSIVDDTVMDNVSDDANSLIDEAPGVDGLQLYGGSTPTRPLQADSDAVDLGDPATCDASPIDNLDQRGAARPPDGEGNGSACDTGAFERTGDSVLTVERNGPQQVLVGPNGDVALGEDLVVLAFSLTNDGDDSVNVEGFNTRPLFNGGVGALRQLVENDPETAADLTFEVVLDDNGNGELDETEGAAPVGTGDANGREFVFDGGAGRNFPAGESEAFLVVLRLSDTQQAAGLFSAPPILAGGLLLGLLGLVRIRGLRRRVQWSFLVLLLTVGLAACSESTGIDELEPPAPPIPETPDPTLQGSLRFELFQLTSTSMSGEIVIGDGLPVYGPAIGLQ